MSGKEIGLGREAFYPPIYTVLGLRFNEPVVKRTGHAVKQEKEVR